METREKLVKTVKIGSYPDGSQTFLSPEDNTRYSIMNDQWFRVVYVPPKGETSDGDA